jgi:Surface antigen.
LSHAGFCLHTRQGAHYALGNAEVRFPILKLFTTYLNPKELYNTQLILFYDMGMSWTTGNPFSQRNPVDLEVLDDQTAVVMRVQSLKRPLLQGFGAAVQTVVLGLDLRLDVAWGLEDGSIGTPIGAVTIGTGF